MGIQQRRAREKEELRSKILEAATDLFIQEGFENVSMRKIADRIEYSPSTIYLYFKDKSELCRSICNDTFENLHASLVRTIELQLPPEQMLRRCLRTYIDFGLNNPQQYIFTLCLPEPEESNEHPEEVRNSILTTGLKAFSLLHQGLADSMDAGAIRRQDPELTAKVVWTMIHGLTSLLITMPTFPFGDRELLIETHLDHVLHSLKG